MIKSFEGSRGLAAIFVALYHLQYHLQIGAVHISAIRNGYIFVELFFVLSGFVICAAYSSKFETMEAFRPFLLRRFGRLFPLLIFSTSLYVMAQNAESLTKLLTIELGYGNHLNNPDSLLKYIIPSAAEIFSTLTLTHGMGFFDKLILNYASWSISTEFFTYILFSVVCFFLRGRVRLITFAILSIVGFLVTVWASIDVHECLSKHKCFDITYDFGFARCTASFFLGALVYHFSRIFKFNSNVLQITSVSAIISLFYLMDFFPWLTFLFPLLFGVLVLSLSSDIGIIAWLLKSKPLQILGERSYSIYMIHPIFLIFFSRFFTNASGVFEGGAAIVAYMVIIVVISGWTYRLIEDPFRIIFNRIAAQKNKKYLPV